MTVGARIKRAVSRLPDRYNLIAHPVSEVLYLIGLEALSKMQSAHVEAYWESFANQVEADIDKAIVSCGNRM